MMFTETMSLQVGRFIFCLLVTAVTLCQADLQLSMDRTTYSIYCGQLQCLANYNEFDTRVLSIAELSIYELIQVNLKVKLASVSMFNPNLFVEPSKVNVLNVTGSVSRYHGELTLSLRDVTDCLYGIFSCELDFLNRDIQADVISDSLTPDLPVLENGTCQMLGSQLSNIEVQINTHSDSVGAELAQIKIQSDRVEAELAQIKTQSDRVEAELAQIKTHSDSVETVLAQIKTHSDSVETVLAQIKTHNTAMSVNMDIVIDQLTRLETIFNSSQEDLKVSCVKGMSYTRPRDKFLLWGTVPAMCDRDTDGGGWVIIQRRTNGDVDFFRNWATYKKGFGTRDTDFWIGNDNIHKLTSQGYTELWINMVRNTGSQMYARYSSFTVGDEVSKYKLSVSGFSGTAEDSISYHNGMHFYTFDRDNERRFAMNHRAGWWFTTLYYSNLNARLGATNLTGAVWNSKYNIKYLTLTEMKVRHV